MFADALEVRLPEWLAGRLGAGEIAAGDVEGRMRLMIELAGRNVRERTGGPFAAGVFDDEGRLVGCGVNLVESARCSIWHAEMVALAMAQKALGRFDLGDGGRADCELVTSTEPCAMCYGAIPWSGVSRLVCGARDEDARRIGFDEGPKLKNWVEELERRGIEVVRDVLRNEASRVLDDYAAGGGRIYNSAKAIKEQG